MRKQNSTFKTAFTSEVDKNLKNTDSFGFVELDKFACYVVADGIDDQIDGKSAKLAVDTIISVFSESPSIKKRTLRRCLKAANQALLHSNSKMHLKASVTMLVTDYVKLRYGQVGNTRFRFYRDGFLRKKSTDQSLSMDLVQEEKLEPDKLQKHAERNNLYCYLGQENNFKPYISPKIKLSNADAAALLTRGVWEHIDDGLLQDTFADASDDPQETVNNVEDLLLSSQPKDLESYTFAAIFFNKIYTDPNRKRKIKRAVILSAIIVVIIAFIIIIALVLYNRRQNKIGSMMQNFYDTIEYIQQDNYIRAQEQCQSALDLAAELHNDEIQRDASRYMKLIESVIAGDDALSDNGYSDAQRYFLNARNQARYADNLGMDYIDSRLEQTSQYMSVYELISLGDTLAQNLQYDKAEAYYLDAKALAARLYFDSGRDDAINALDQLYVAQEEQQAQADTDIQQVAESQTAAASVVAEGDTAFSLGDYDSAKTYYTTALQKYTDLADQVQVEALQIKLNATEKKLSERTQLETEAEDYMRQAEERYDAKDYVQAKKFYLLAKDVFSELKMDSKVSEITRKLELVDMGETAKAAEEAAIKEAAEKEAAEKAAAEKEAAEKAAAEKEKSNILDRIVSLFKK